MSAVHKARIERLKVRMKEEGFNAVLLTDIPSVTYATGTHFDHWGWSGGAAFIPLEGEVTIIGPAHDTDRISSLFKIDGQYRTFNPPLGKVPEVRFEDRIKEIVKEQRLEKRTIGYEGRGMSAAMYGRLREALADVVLKDASQWIDEVMMIKDAEEIELMRRVAAIADAGIKAALDAIKVGRTDAHVAGEASRAMHYAGADYLWAMVTVASGYRNYMDSWTTQKVIQRGDVVKIGCHPAYEHYRADTLRSAIVGKPSDKLKRLCETTVEAGMAMLEAMKPGVMAGEVDRVFRKKMEAAGYGEYCLWRTGHGIGTRHLPPLMHSGDKTILKPNMVVVVQPFAYLPEGGGFAIEHMVLIGEKRIEDLNKIPIKLFELGEE